MHQSAAILSVHMDRFPTSTELNALSASAKFAPPRIGSRYIQRTDLLKKLWRDRHAKLTLVTGSPGFGKTSLMAQWRQELMKSGDRVCWLSLSADEDSLAGFAAHCLAALEQLGVSLDEELLLVSEGAGLVDRAVVAIVNALAARDDELHLLIDDFHCVRDPRAHLFLQKLIDHNPGNLHVTLASRATPPLSLAKLRVMGQVAEIDCAELPFSLTETRSFLKHSLGPIRLDAGQSMDLHERTQGWPASLQLLSIMLRNQPASDLDWRRFDWGTGDLQAYLTEEVVGALPPDVAEFMAILSLCRRFSAPLARAMTGRDDAGAMIDRIEQDNLLLIREESDDREPWFRFHPMLGDYLQTRVARQETTAVHAYHRRASRWFDGQNMIVEAISHAAQGDDPDFAASVAQRVTPEMWRLSQMGALHRLVNALPLSAIAPYPKLVYFSSITLAFVGAPTQAAALEAYFPDHEDATDRFRRILLQVTIALRRDDTDRALRLLENIAVPAETSSFERQLLLGGQTIALAAVGRFGEAYDLVDRYEAQLLEPNEGMALLALEGRGMAMLIQGRVAAALPLLQKLYRRSMTLQPGKSAGTDLIGINIAHALYELNELDDARVMLTDRQQNTQRAFPQFMIVAALTEARLEARRSRKAGLAAIETHLERFLSFGLDRGAAHLLLLRLEIELSARAADAARTTARQLSDIGRRHLESRGLLAEIGLIIHCAQARLALFERRFDDAMEDAEAAWTRAEALDQRKWVVIFDLLRARIDEARGALGTSQDHFECALARAEPLGLVRTFLDEGEAVPRLLDKAIASKRLGGNLATYAEMLRDQAGRERHETSAAQPNSDNASPLSPREEEIIRLLAANMSNKRIASTIGISIETVKWNLKNVFQKLGVSSRYHAVTWARQHDLINRQ